VLRLSGRHSHLLEKIVAVISLTPRTFADSRGWFSETYNQARAAEAGIDVLFCQDNQSFSTSKGIIRGLHYQRPPFAQAKLVRCMQGSIWDVAVDARRGSPTYGQWVAAELSAQNRKQLFIPAGFLHGFVTLEDNTEVAYKVSALYDAASDGGIRWDDPTLALPWPLDGQALVSDKDAALPFLAGFDSPFDYDGVPLRPLTEN
jgi:dTDP-4-dehydrorhamnose 3,5-epimerase